MRLNVGEFKERTERKGMKVEGRRFRKAEEEEVVRVVGGLADGTRLS